MTGYPREAPGPFRAHQIRDGDHYELSDGHAIHCMTAGEQHAKANLTGGRVLATDPEVAGAAGVDAGFSFNGESNLRAPDISTGVGDGPGWMRSAPPLAVEYAGKGQDEPELQAKIKELLAAGTRYLWVVRLTGTLRVEVHTPGEPLRIFDAEGVLTAPGVLRNPVPVRALVDGKAANAATLRNLLNAEGYESLEDLRAKSHAEGQKQGEMQARAQAIETVLRARGLMIEDRLLTRLQSCRDPVLLGRWLVQSATAATADAALD